MLIIILHNVLPSHARMHARRLTTEQLQRMVVFSSNLTPSGLAPVQSQCELLVVMVEL